MSNRISTLLIRNLRGVFGENDPEGRRAATDELYTPKMSWRVPWVFGRPGDAPEYAGTDFIIARDGRIAAICLFFDKMS